MKKLIVDLDNNKRYKFYDYDNYTIEDKYFIITKGYQWIGFFERAHLVGFFIDD